MQAEAQESIIADVSSLCDTVEAMCRAEEEDFAQSLIDLPIWGSPRELMRSLCDEWEEVGRYEIVFFAYDVI